MVVTPEPHATRAGLRLLDAGGNAVDAAVAAAFALGVTQPQSTGIGGGAFLLVRLADGRSFALDARETAPAASTQGMYLEPGLPERPSLIGGLAVGTPGMVAGLALAVERWGSRPLAETLAPAIELAEQGYPLGAYQARFISRLRAPLSQRAPDTAAIQFPPADAGDGVGWVLVQRDLGRTLARIARQGPDGFYRGPVAEQIVKAV
ncbi:MAG: gamma-glutamyltransferase, partial [Myxococcota bacterium]